MSERTVWPVLMAMIALPTVAIGQPTDPNRYDSLFNRYPVAQVYNGQVHLPDFRNRDRAFSLFRTRIRDGLKSGPNFAGHFAIVVWGCGTQCVNYVIGDVSTGRVFKFPLGGEEYLELELVAKPKSRAIVAKWVEYADMDPKSGEMMMKCMRQDFVWNGTTAAPLSKPVAAATLKNDDSALCDK